MTDQDNLDARAITAGTAAIRAAVDQQLPLLGMMLTNTSYTRWAEAAIRAAGEVYDADRREFVDRQVADARIAGWDINGDGMDLRVAMARETAAGLVQAAKTFLDANPAATNYVEQTVIDRDSGDRYVIVFQKPGGKTPHELRQQAEVERDWLLAEAPDDLRARFFAVKREEARS